MFGFIKEYRSSQAVVSSKYDLIFYVENGYYFQYIRHLFEAFAGRPGLRIAYISSDEKDPMLLMPRTGVEPFYLKATLLFVWPRLQAKVLVMTMPGLGGHGYSRAPGVAKYVYVFHALVSMHQQYPAGSFNDFDALFCCGPYHEREARRTELIDQLPARDLVPYGYPLLEELRGRESSSGACILLAPSWHPQGILTTCLNAVLDGLLQLSLPVEIRPHPEFRKRQPKAMKALEARVAGTPRLQIDRSDEVFTRLASAALLVTDRSGIALEYAFARRRPVLFIDTPPKIFNPDFEKLELTPIEDALRPLLGESVDPRALDSIAATAQKLLQNAPAYAQSLGELENETVFGAGNAEEGIRYLELWVS
jgi:hypothetical protein